MLDGGVTELEGVLGGQEEGIRGNSRSVEDRVISNEFSKCLYAELLLL